jgi:hypothetical protein
VADKDKIRVAKKKMVAKWRRARPSPFFFTKRPKIIKDTNKNKNKNKQVGGKMVSSAPSTLSTGAAAASSKHRIALPALDSGLASRGIQSSTRRVFANGHAARNSEKSLP